MCLPPLWKMGVMVHKLYLTIKKQVAVVIVEIASQSEESRPQYCSLTSLSQCRQVVSWSVID